jgi:biopolymer transport protein ExbD
MAAKLPQAFDVWLVATDTVYKGVPSHVTVSWAEQGRLGVNDKLRPSATELAWVTAGDHPQVSGFLFRQGAPATAEYSSDLAEQMAAVELGTGFGHKPEEEEDDPDMIPLIDVSLVLLVFFMMTASVSALSPVPVPEMKNVSEMHSDPEAMTIHIDMRVDGTVFFALRVGDKLNPDDNDLKTPEDVLRKLDEKLAGVQRAPEVRVACHKDIKRGWVRDIARELDKRKQKDLISFYGAEVNEKK